MSSGTVNRADEKTGDAGGRSGIFRGAVNSDRVANRQSVTESAELSEAAAQVAVRAGK